MGIGGNIGEFLRPPIRSLAARFLTNRRGGDCRHSIEAVSPTEAVSPAEPVSPTEAVSPAGPVSPTEAVSRPRVETRPEAAYLRDKFCEKPFVDFEITPTGGVFVCCPNYLPYPIGSVKRETAEALLNSAVAQDIRRSIIDGSFAYCSTERCPAIRERRLPKRAEVADPEMAAYIGRDDGIVAAPRHVRLSYDSTCNLHCPSCRKEKIALKGAGFDEAMRITNEIALPVLRGAHTVMMNGYGDIFSSRICRHLLHTVDPAEYPNLKFLFITNGVLLTEEEWNKFPNIHRMVHSIRVSIDAASKAVYDVVRLGGDFAKLCANLEFIAQLRQKGVIAEFLISMVVQRENFREMEAFWKWGERLGCDFVVYERIQDWGVFGPEDFNARAVHLPDHPLHGEYLEAMAILLATVETGSGRPALTGDIRTFA